jgi:phosphatidyl-myo-inositol dimannoside synthase
MIHKKILLISPDYPPPLIGGSLVYMNNLIENSNLDYIILSNKNNRVDTENIKYLESAFIIDSTSPNTAQLIKMYVFLFFYVLNKSSEYSCIILNISAIGNGFISSLLSVLKKKIIIIAYAEELTVAIYSKSIKGIVKRLFMRGYKKASMIISVSHFAKNILQQSLSVKCPINVIPTPLHDEKLIQGNDSDQLTRKGMLSVGRLIKRKGFDLLLQAYMEVKKDLPDTILTIIGSGPEFITLKNIIDENNLADSVKIYSNVDSSFLRKQYQSHELFILANLMLENGDCEGAPNVLIEAGAYGLPSIAGEEGGTSDVVEDGITGLLIDPTNIEKFSLEILSLLKNKNKLQSMGNKAAEKVKKDHNKKKAGEKFKNYILECIDS